MKRWSRRLSCLFVCANVVSIARADAPAAALAPLPAEVTWGDVARLMHERSPRVAALHGAIRVADANIELANVLPNPSLDYTGYKRIGNGDNYATQHQVGLSTPLWLGGQRAARKRSAERKAELARVESVASETELTVSALHAWISLLAAQARVTQLEAARTDVGLVGHTVHERVNAGAESAYDAARVDLEDSQLALRIDEARAEVIEASANLAQVAGLADWHPRAFGTLAPLGVDADFAKLWQRAQTTLPALIAAEKNVVAAQSGIAVARAERWPVPTLSGGAFLTADHGSTSLYLGLSMPLPIFDFGGAAIDRAQAEVMASQGEHSAANAAARVELGGAVSTLVAKRETLRAYDASVSARLPGLREMAEYAYKSGTASLLELLDSVRTGIDVTLERVNLARDVVHAELDVLAGAGLLEAQPPSPLAAGTKTRN